MVAQRRRSSAFCTELRWRVFCEPLVDGGARGEPLGHVAGLVFQVEHHPVGHGLVELVGVDVGAEHVPGGLPVPAQQRRAGEADEDRAGQPAFHLPVHVAALAAVTLVDKHVETAVHRRPGAVQVGRVELVQQGAEQARRGRAQPGDQLGPRGQSRRRPAGAGHPGVVHHALDLLVQLVTVGDHQHARLRIVLQEPLRKQDHEDALAAALGVPDHPALAPGDARLRRLDRQELVRPGHLLAACVEDDEMMDQIEQPRLLAQPGKRPVEQRPGAPVLPVRAFIRPLDEKLFRRADGAVAQPLGVAAGEQELHRAEKPLVEDLLLVGLELAHPVGHLHRTALEFKHRDGQAVQVEDDVRPPLQAAAQGHLLGQGEVVCLRMVPVDQMHGFVRPAHGHLHRYAVAQQVVGAQVGLVQGDAGGVGRGFELLQGCTDLRLGISAPNQILAQQVALDGPVVRARTPVAEIAIAERVGPRLVGEQADDACLGRAFGAGLVNHGHPCSVGSRGGAETRRAGDC